MSSFDIHQKRRRESTSSFTDEDNNGRRTFSSDDTKPAQKKKKKNRTRQNKKSYRIRHFNSRKDFENLDLDGEMTDPEDPNISEHKSSTSIRPPISSLEQLRISIPTPDTTTTTTTTTTTDHLISTLDKITDLINNDDLSAAYQLLSATTRTNDWQATATLESALTIYNYTKLLGDGGKQSLEQARVIEDLQRKQMELEAEVVRLKKGRE